MEFVFTEDAVMDSMEIRGFRTDLSRFLRRFKSCAQDKNTRNFFRIYIQGLMFNVPRKNAEAIALQAGEPVRSPAYYFLQLQWLERSKKNGGLTFYQVSRLAATELTPTPTVSHTVFLNAYY